MYAAGRVTRTGSPDPGAVPVSMLMTPREALPTTVGAGAPPPRFAVVERVGAAVSLPGSNTHPPTGLTLRR